MSATTKKRTRKKTIKLDIACGKNKGAVKGDGTISKGWTGVDISPDCEADIIHDLTTYPWPFEDNSVSEAFCCHYVEHIPMEVSYFTAENGSEPALITRNGMIAFMEEVYRILKPGAKIKIIHPHLRTDRAFQDPTHTRFIPEAHWYYWAKDWREQEKLDHYPITTDFGIDQMFYNAYQGDWGTRSQEMQQRAVLNYWNVVVDLVVVLKKR